MTKNEALKAAIDGKKIRCVQWVNQNAYVFWSGQNFYHVPKVGGNTETATAQIVLEQFNDWQIVPEYVDFATALKAYRNSATIKSITGEKYSLKREDETLCVNLKEIEGKWLILEDE